MMRLDFRTATDIIEKWEEGIRSRSQSRGRAVRYDEGILLHINVAGKRGRQENTLTDNLATKVSEKKSTAKGIE